MTEEEDIKDLPTLDYGITYKDLNYYLVLKNHPELMDFLCWLAEQLGGRKKIRRLFQANPLVESLKKLVGGYIDSNLHFFQFQILHHSGFVDDIEKLESLFDDCDGIRDAEKSLVEASERVIDNMRNVEKLMDFVIFNNYTENQDIADDLANVDHMLQRNKLLDFEFTANLRNIDAYRDAIVLIDSEIFQKQFNLHLARARFDEILRAMFGAEDTREASDTQVLRVLLRVSARVGEQTPRTETKLSLEDFWAMMGRARESYKADLTLMSKKSEGTLPMAEIEYAMSNVDKVKEVDVLRRAKTVKIPVLLKALKNFFVVRNLSKIYVLLEQFVKKMEIDFKEDLGGLKSIASKAESPESNFFELVNLSLEVDPRMRSFCEGDSIMYRFIENNLTIWKGETNADEFDYMVRNFVLKNESDFQETLDHIQEHQEIEDSSLIEIFKVFRATLKVLSRIKLNHASFDRIMRINADAQSRPERNRSAEGAEDVPGEHGPGDGEVRGREADLRGRDRPDEEREVQGEPAVQNGASRVRADEGRLQLAVQVGLTRLVIIEKTSEDKETKNRTYKEEKVNEFYSMCKMKNKHDSENQSQEYIHFEQLYEHLRQFNSLLNQFTERGITPDDKFVKALEFGTQLDKNAANPNERQTKDNIREVKERVVKARRHLEQWEKQKRRFLADPYTLENFISLQMMGKSLIKLTPTNFRFYVQFLENELSVGSVDHLDRLDQVTETDQRLEQFLLYFRDNRKEVKETLARNTVHERQQIFLKFVELEMQHAYNFVLNKFQKASEPYTADQILFCSWHLKWAEVESRRAANGRIHLPVGLRPAQEAVRAVQLLGADHHDPEENGQPVQHSARQKGGQAPDAHPVRDRQGPPQRDPQGLLGHISAGKHPQPRR